MLMNFLQDFLFSETVSFTRDGLLQKTPAHRYSEFKFRTYAPYAFRFFRHLFEIETELFLASLCSEPMVELANPGVSGSIFYVTRYILDNFLVD
jgi:1-phosphatidylinositol-4-phosphate 5-kinase